MAARATLLTTIALLAGCTSGVVSTPIDTAKTTGGNELEVGNIPHGIVYHLPAREIAVEALYRLNSCPNISTAQETAIRTRIESLANTFSVLGQKVSTVDRDGTYDEVRESIRRNSEEITSIAKQIETLLQQTLVVTVSGIEASQHSVPDYLAGTFVIETRELTTWLKEVSEAKVVVENGLLRSVAYEAKDKTRDVIAGISGLAFRIASQTATMAVPGGQAAQGIANIRDSGAIQALNAGLGEQGIFIILQGELDDLRQSLDNAIADLDYCNPATMTALAGEAALKDQVKTAKTEVAKANAAYQAALKPSDGTAPNADAVKVAKARLEEAQKRLSAETAKLAKLIAANLTAKINRRFLPQRTALSFDVKPTTDILQKWFNSNRFLSTGTSLVSAMTMLQVTVEPIPDSNIGDVNKAPTFNGIYYRVPRPAKLLISRLGNASDVLQGATPAYVPAANPESVLFHQFGVLAALEIENGIFQENKYVVSFTEDGLLHSFEYQEKSARALGAVDTAEDVLDAKDDAAINAVDRETKLLEAERKRLEELKKLQDAENALIETDE
ncbi:hypothetical protein EOI86_09825 [Hwanghaeella grinnelliae]|uniref:Uncharacterized protein n=1 Tax=Hwanghaeella grinnelliae TaxID=2500179 RepID=A0A437QYA2_9PROT|nr:hypothetical protein [Hwanghaeella grinnelliae]RVU39504.1 hypothetical protein EOI86_09825 [Hwanghaeella grinnelliae]